MELTTPPPLLKEPNYISQKQSYANAIKSKQILNPAQNNPQIQVLLNALTEIIVKLTQDPQLATHIIDGAFRKHLGLALNCDNSHQTAIVTAAQENLPTTSQPISISRYYHG